MKTNLIFDFLILTFEFFSARVEKIILTTALIHKEQLQQT